MQFISAVFFVWSGLIVGVSFIATPVKFLAPNLPIAHALSVGRVTFNALSWVEAGFYLTVCIFFAASWAFWERLERGVLFVLVAIGIVLAVQYLWIMPILDDRLLRTISGEVVGKSNLHLIYVAIESLKLLMIFTTGILLVRWRTLGNGR